MSTTLPQGFPGLISTEQLTALINALISSLAYSGATITASTVNSSPIGGSVPSTGAFTTLAASGATALSGANTLSGATTVSGTLSATNTVTLSPASHNVVLSPTGTGVVTIAPATLGTLDKVTIGGVTPAAATVTALVTSGAVVHSNAALTLSAIPTADPHVVGRVWANSGVLTISAG